MTWTLSTRAHEPARYRVEHRVRDRSRLQPRVLVEQAGLRRQEQVVERWEYLHRDRVVPGAARRVGKKFRVRLIDLSIALTLENEDRLLHAPNGHEGIVDEVLARPRVHRRTRHVATGEHGFYHRFLLGSHRN